MTQARDIAQQEFRWPGIDALRGLTVILVVLHHIHIRFILNDFEVQRLLPPPLSRVLFWSGYYAVIGFFVISGFLITRRSLQRWRILEHIPIRHFYWLRVARLWPTLVLLLLVLSALHLTGVQGFVIPPERSSLGRALFAALGLHLNWLEGYRGYLPGAWDVLWSLSVEEIFYLLLPLLCVTLRRRLLLPALLLIIAGPINRAVLAGQEPWDSYAYLSCLDAIVFGCVAAWLSQQRLYSHTQLRTSLLLGLACIALVVVFRGTTRALGLVDTGLHVSVLALGVAAVLLAMAGNPTHEIPSRLTAPLRWAGHHSYETYLCHMFVVLGGVQWFKQLAIQFRWIGCWYAALLAASLLLGFALSHLYSNPLNHWLRRRVSTQTCVPQPELLAKDKL